MRTVTKSMTMAKMPQDLFLWREHDESENHVNGQAHLVKATLLSEHYESKNHANSGQAQLVKATIGADIHDSNSESETFIRSVIAGQK